MRWCVAITARPTRPRPLGTWTKRDFQVAFQAGFLLPHCCHDPVNQDGTGRNKTVQEGRTKV